MNSKRLTGVTFVSLIVVLVFCLGRDPVLHALGSFLVVEDQSKRVDVIVVLGGKYERVNQAVVLYKKGFAKFIIMSGRAMGSSTNMAEEMKSIAISDGVPEDKILIDSMSQHTYQHPLFVKPILISHSFKSAIILSSTYHMRRTALLFDRVFYQSNIKLIYYPVIDSEFNPGDWWQSVEGRKIVFSEYTKMAVNIWGTRVNDFITTWFLKDKKG